MPSSTAFWTAGAMAKASWAKTISTSAFRAMRLLTSANCFCADDCASAEIYLSPAAAMADFIAASSVFQRSSWKFAQETPTTFPAALALAQNRNDTAAPATKAAANFIISPPLDGPSIRIQVRRYRGFLADSENTAVYPLL